MITAAVITFREFLEAFLIVGVFLGISQKLNLKKEKEISFAALLGILLSLSLSAGMYLFGNRARSILTEKNADLLESYLQIFSGVFLAYVVVSLHNILRKKRGNALIKAHQKLQKNAFDASLFFTIVFLVLREGFEIVLFTASVSLFSEFSQNFTGLILGFIAASLLAAGTVSAYIRFPLGKVFKFTEYLIILLGASLVQNGLTKLLDHYFRLNISEILSFQLKFLPGEDTFIGHLLQGFVGVDQNFSLARLLIMVIYMSLIYRFFFRKKMTEIKS